MESTVKLYEADAFCKQAEGTITAIEAESSNIILDRTIFYPEGGGQGADTGTLTLKSGETINIIDSHEAGGVIRLKAERLPANLSASETVTQKIDWEQRFDRMQQHTGEHILSGLLHSLFGAENVGFHIGADAVRMDTSVEISDEGLAQAELEANRVIWRDVPVVISYPTREELAQMTYRSKKEIEGQVRIVSIEGADVCACCGTHTATAGQVGQIKIISRERYKGGMRLFVVCGGRALNFSRGQRAREAEIGALLSAKSAETANAVRRVYEEYSALKFAHFGLCDRLFEAVAAAVQPDETVVRIMPALSPDELHRFASRLAEATSGLCAALTPTDKGTGYCIARRGDDVRAVTKALNAALGGRGGGKREICQGSCAASPEEVKTFLENFK